MRGAVRGEDAVVTVILARSHDNNPLNAERIFAIGTVAVCWFTVGRLIERNRHEKDDDADSPSERWF